MALTIDELAEVGEIPGFEAIRLIGRGGMGVVYLARQASLGRLVAIKLLGESSRADADERVARFRREAQLMALVPHPNIVAIHDIGIFAGRPFLVLEYVAGGDLGLWIRPDRPVSPARVRPLVGPIARALTCLHGRGILHRDLKPTNILMLDETTPKVSDFGIAVPDLAPGNLTRSGLAMGTPGYVAPEQQYGLKVDERADQYSMAAVFYELLTGRKPLGSFGPPSRYNPGVGPAVDEALMRALHEERDGRFATVEEFGTALDAALGEAVPKAGAFRVGAGLAAAAVVAGLGVGALVRLANPGFGPKSGPVDGPRLDPRAIAAPALPAEVVDGLGTTFKLIHPNDFIMGAPESDADAHPWEKPSRPVRLTRPYYLATTEVTVDQFRRFVEAAGYKTDAERLGGGGVFDMAAEKVVQRPGVDWRKPGGRARVQAGDEPVVQVSYNDALAFCAWLSKLEGRAYRLPTEAEWEAACRAGTTTRWSTGEAAEALDHAAWTPRNAGTQTHPVGHKTPNPWGFYDMHGNAWEWVSDWYAPYPAGPAVDPVGPEKGDLRVVRGGGWDWPTTAKTRSSSRLGFRPDQGFFTYGFRLAMTPPAPDGPARKAAP